MISGDYLRVAVMVEPPGLHNHRPDHTLRQWIRVFGNIERRSDRRVSPSDNGDKPVVEPKQQGDGPDLTQRALQQRIRQQEILAELGVTALQGASFDKLLNDTARLTAEGLHAEFCKVLEHLPSENRLLVRAGVGWGEGVVGVATVGADLASPAGFALRTGKPVISNHLGNEERFRTPELLIKSGIYRAMNVILQGEGKPFGVLEVDGPNTSSAPTTLPSPPGRCEPLG